jgi:hypothetical protein
LSRCTGCIEEKNSGSSSEGDRITEDSIELCQEGIEQEGIEQVHCAEENSIFEFIEQEKQQESLRDSGGETLPGGH